MISRKQLIYDQFPNNSHIDILIIGAGLSGLQVAKDLGARNVDNIWVFEAGPNMGLQHINLKYDDNQTFRMWKLLTEDTSFYRPWISVSPPYYSGTSGLRRRLGGRSLYWGGGILRIEPWALNSMWWPESIVRDLTEGDDVHLSFYELQEREVGDCSPTRETEFLVKFLKSSSYPSVVPMPLAVKYHHLTDGSVRWSSYSPLDAWRMELEQNDNHLVSGLPQIACNTEVLSLLTNYNRVVGVRIRNTQNKEIREVHASSVVLAAGTIENARLSLDALISSGHIGQPILSGLTDHLITSYTYRVLMDKIPREYEFSQVPGIVLIPGTESSKFNLIASITRPSINDHIIYVDTWTIGEQLPRSDNLVFLETLTPAPQPAYVRASLSMQDQDVIEQMQQALSDFSNNLLSALGTSTTIVDPISSIHPLGTTEHEGGTLTFGSILQETGEFKDIRALYAVGPCTFPRMGAANPSLTSLALAKRTARLLDI